MHFIGILIPLLLIAISGHFIWRSTESFAIAADYLGRNMSKGVKGASINAIASSMPEFLTTMFFLFYIKDEGIFIDSFSGGLGVVAGSAVFNILVIPIAVILFGTSKYSKNSFKLDKSILKRDGIFLMASNAVFIVIISQRIIAPIHGIFLIVIYITYLLFLRKGLGLGNKDTEEFDFHIPKEKIGIRHYLMVNIKQIILNDKELNGKRAWITLAVSTILMSCGTLLLVEGTKLLGSNTYTIPFLKGEFHGLDLPIILISVLLASAATSIPDTIISVRDAKKGNFDDAISNALGSNIFDLSFALGLPLLLYTLIHGNIEMSLHVRNLSVIYWIFMGIITVIVIPTFLFSKKISKITGVLLLILYLIFVVTILEEALKFAWFQNAAEAFINFVNR